MICLLGVVTIIYMGIAAVEDIRERKIYGFPCEILSVAWIFQSLIQGKLSWTYLIAYAVVGIILAIVMDLHHIWGEGDSDLLLLFMSVYITFCEGYGLSEMSRQLCLFALAILLSFAIGFCEFKVRGRKLEKNSSIAVAPGIAIVIVYLILQGVMAC